MKQAIYSSFIILTLLILGVNPIMAQEVEPTGQPTIAPTAVPTTQPNPTTAPTQAPQPTAVPTSQPNPTAVPTQGPVPTQNPSPTGNQVSPTASPTIVPTAVPTSTASNNTITPPIGGSTGGEASPTQSQSSSDNIISTIFGTGKKTQPQPKIVKDVTDAVSKVVNPPLSLVFPSTEGDFYAVKTISKNIEENILLTALVLFVSGAFLLLSEQIVTALYRVKFLTQHDTFKVTKLL